MFTLIAFEITIEVSSYIVLYCRVILQILLKIHYLLSLSIHYLYYTLYKLYYTLYKIYYTLYKIDAMIIFHCIFIVMHIVT